MSVFYCKVCKKVETFYAEGDLERGFYWRCLNCNSICVPSVMRYIGRFYGYPNWIISNKMKEGKVISFINRFFNLRITYFYDRQHRGESIE